MKVKTTRKSIVNSTPERTLKCAGYCDLQALLRNHQPTAYTTGIYGWNFDVDEVYGITICTGYRGMPGTRLENISEYEKKAADIWSYYTDYKGADGHERQRDEVEKLLEEFCKKNGGR
jgi:hypothetical protein